RLLAKELVVEVFDFRGEAKKRIGIEVARVGSRSRARSTRARVEYAEDIRKLGGGSSVHMPRARIEHPAIVLHFRVNAAVADEPEAAHLGRLQKWIRAEAIPDSRRRRLRIGRYRIDLGAARVVVKSHVADREMLDRIGRRRSRPVARDLDVP